MRGFVEEQAPTLRRLPDARNAIDDLKREPAAAIFARAHSGIGDTGDEALFRSILVPMLTWTAERSGGFDWHDDAFDAAYADLELTLFGSARTYVALAPVIGLSAGNDADLGGGVTLRPIVSGEISHLWPEAQGLMPAEFGRDTDRMLLLELRRDLRARRVRAPGRGGGARRCGHRPATRDCRARSRPGPSSSNGSTSGRCASRLCFRSRRLSRAAKRHGSTRCARGLAAELRERLPLADADRELGEALDRWELSLFSEEPFRSAQIREGLVCLLGGDGGAWAATMRAAVLLTEKGRERSELLDTLRAERLGRDARDAVRRALVETLLHGSRDELVLALDDTLLGIRPRPASVLRVA